MEETPQAVAEKSKDSSKKKTTSATDSIALLPYLIRFAIFKLHVSFLWLFDILL